MKRKVPPEVLANLLGMSVGQVEECLRETAIQMLRCFNVSWTGRDPVEVFGEYIDSLVEKPICPPPDPDRAFLAYFQKAVELSPDEKEWLILDGDFEGPFYLTVPWSLVGKNAKLKKLMGFVKKRSWWHSENVSLSLLSRQQLAEIETGADPEVEYDPTLADLVGSDFGGVQFLPEDLWVHPDLEKTHPCIRSSVAKLLDLK